MKTVEESLADILYFRALNSALLQEADLKRNYSMLLEQYKKHPTSFNCFTKNDLLRIKQIQEDIRNNRSTLLCLPSDITPHTLLEVPQKEKSHKKHEELCGELVRNYKDTFEPYIGPINFVATEHPTRYGPIDIVLQSKDIIYIVEVKTDRATHGIVEQVLKYYVGLSLKLILRLFDEVRIITICPGYDKASLSGLKRIGAEPFILNPKSFEIKRLAEI